MNIQDATLKNIRHIKKEIAKLKAQVVRMAKEMRKAGIKGRY